MSFPKSLERHYNLLIPHLEAVASYIQSLLKFLHSSDFALETSIKPLSSIVRKLKNKKGSNILKLPDLVRGRLYYSPSYTQEGVLRLLKKIAKDKITKIDLKGECGFGLKYKGVAHIDFQVGPFTFELQVVPMEFKPFQKFWYRIYEKIRDENHLTKQQKEKLRNLHNRLYDDLTRKARENRR
jgi:hypothetical protein